MAKKMYELRDMLCEELYKVQKKVSANGGELSAAELEVIDKLTHSIKSIDTIIAMKESHFENDDDDDDGYSRGASYNNGNGSYSARSRGRNARRDSRGRYASNYYRRNDPYRGRSYGNYGDDDTKEVMLDHIEDMLDEAKDERQRQMIMSFKSQIETL